MANAFLSALDASDPGSPPTLTTLASIPRYPYPRLFTVSVVILSPVVSPFEFSAEIASAVSFENDGSVISMVPVITPFSLSASVDSRKLMYLILLN